MVDSTLFRQLTPHPRCCSARIERFRSDASPAGLAYVATSSVAADQPRELGEVSYRTEPAGPASGGLSRQQLRRVIDFIEVNMEKPLDLHDLSAAACLNPVYFGRQFKRTTNMSPHQFKHPTGPLEHKSPSFGLQQ
jgi:hypothetical protein